MTAYYNEIDRHAAMWLRELIKARLIVDGDVDERSIEDVKADDLKRYQQCHFFAGIGGWSYALRLAGWPDDRPVWTGSCPCQPFSVAGEGRGFTDARHLWPAFCRLIRKSRPSVVFGEQVAGKRSARWIDQAADDLEGIGYAFGASVLPACCVGSRQRRYRWYFVADTQGIKARTAKSRHGAGSDAAKGSSGVQQARRVLGSAVWAHWLSEPSIPLVVDGLPGIVDQISGAGNAIVPQVAAEFIKAYLEGGEP